MDSTQRRIINHWSSLEGLGFFSLVITTEYVNIVAERLPGLVEAMCRNVHFPWRSEDKVFGMNSIGSYRISRLTLDIHWISFKQHELGNMQYILYMITNQLLIQGVTGGMCEISGECSLGQTIPI